jgi:hypothetical protein
LAALKGADWFHMEHEACLFSAPKSVNNNFWM